MSRVCPEPGGITLLVRASLWWCCRWHWLWPEPGVHVPGFLQDCFQQFGYLCISSQILYIAWCHPLIINAIPTGLFQVKICGIFIWCRKPSNGQLPSLSQRRCSLFLKLLFTRRKCVCCGVCGGVWWAFLQLFIPNTSTALSSSSGATSNMGFTLLGAQEVCQEGSALLLMGAGGSLPGSFQLLLFVKFE